MNRKLGTVISIAVEVHNDILGRVKRIDDMGR